VFRDLVLARIIEPASKADSLRVLTEVGRSAIPAASIHDELHRRRRRRFALGRLSRFGFRPRLFAGRR
jgi:hypothetical protein